MPDETIATDAELCEELHEAFPPDPSRHVVVTSVGELTAETLHGERDPLAPRQQIVAAPVDSLRAHPQNPRKGNVEAIAASLQRHDQYQPIVVQASSGFIIAGNHRYLAARTLGWTHLDVIYLDVDDDQALRILLVDNKTSDDAEYDTRALAELLATFDGDLAGTGYDEVEFESMLEELGALPDSLDGDPEGTDAELDEEPEAGQLLALADVSMGEPHHQPVHGSIWEIGNHLLYINRVHDEHEAWRDKLPGRIFCPYPEPYLTATEMARDSRLLMVQPNRFLAGHLLDKHQAIWPGTIRELPSAVTSGGRA